MDEIIRRLEALEEAVTFTERSNEQLSEQILRAFADLRMLGLRVAALEGRVEAALAKAAHEDEPEPPEAA